jgi:ribonuclease T2
MPMTTLSRVFTAALAACLLLAPAEAKSRKKKKAAAAPQFSYYMLVLSYAPDFCAQPQGNKDPRECGAGRHIGFIVHGLWPQGETSRGPEKCGHVSPVSQAILQATLKYIPTESLIQHEWTAHGSCTGLSAADYFAALRKARDSVTLPADLDQPPQNVQLSPLQVESEIAAANPSFPKTAFRTSCYRDTELQEVRICLNKDLSPRACSASAGECTLPGVTLLPVH